MYEVVVEFVKYLLRNGNDIKRIEKFIKEKTRENVCHVSLNKNKVRGPEKCFESEFEGNPFYVTIEWGLGARERNFDGLMKGIYSTYPDFKIQEIQR